MKASTARRTMAQPGRSPAPCPGVSAQWGSWARRSSVVDWRGLPHHRPGGDLGEGGLRYDNQVCFRIHDHRLHSVRDDIQWRDIQVYKPWSLLDAAGLTGANLWSLASTDTTLFVGDVSGGVWRSTNRGANWTSIHALGGTHHIADGERCGSLCRYGFGSFPFHQQRNELGARRTLECLCRRTRGRDNAVRWRLCGRIRIHRQRHHLDVVTTLRLQGMDRTDKWYTRFRRVSGRGCVLNDEWRNNLGAEEHRPDESIGDGTGDHTGVERRDQSLRRYCGWRRVFLCG